MYIYEPRKMVLMNLFARKQSRQTYGTRARRRKVRVR